MAEEAIWRAIFHHLNSAYNFLKQGNLMGAIDNLASALSFMQALLLILKLKAEEE